MQGLCYELDANFQRAARLLPILVDYNSLVHTIERYPIWAYGALGQSVEYTKVCLVNQQAHTVTRKLCCTDVTCELMISRWRQDDEVLTSYAMFSSQFTIAEFSDKVLKMLWQNLRKNNLKILS